VPAHLSDITSIPLQPTKLGHFRSASGEIEAIKLPKAEVQPRLSFSLSIDGPDKPSAVVECRNHGKGAGASCSIRFSKSGETVWDDAVPSLAVRVASTGTFTAISTEDGGLWVWSKAGRRLLPCAMLEGPASFLLLEGDKLMVVSCVGIVDVW